MPPVPSALWQTTQLLVKIGLARARLSLLGASEAVLNAIGAAAMPAVTRHTARPRTRGGYVIRCLLVGGRTGSRAATDRERLSGPGMAVNLMPARLVAADAGI